MALQDAVKAGPGVDPRRRCGLAAWIATLPEAEQDAAWAILASPEWSTSEAHRAFVREGYSQSLNPVQKHVAGSCACGVS